MNETLDALREESEQIIARIKSDAISDPITVWQSIPDVHSKKGTAFWNLVIQLTDQGIALQHPNPHHDLQTQALHNVIELSKLVEALVEDHVENCIKSEITEKI